MMTVKFTPDDGRRVYAVPVKLIVECTLFVLAIDEAQSKRLVSAINLEDYFSFDEDSLTTDGEQLLKVNDVITHPIDVSVVDISEMSLSDYPPNEHPDFMGIPEK
jgi:hypothetical protein